ncbi:MAG TPA: RNA polymerase-binding protein DksA [Burkholderiales bacterium]|nr:RNA polymerase-binding protein DksA [Burkholderiales bacterium]
MPAKKPSVKASRPRKTVSASAKAASRTAARPAAVKARPAPRKTAPRSAPARPATRSARTAPTPPARPVVPTPPAGDDGEGELRFNLLAGPRNVKPYVARKDEEYMSKQQLDHFRRILASWKQDLMQEVDRTMLHMKDEAANFPDPNDRATQESEFSLELRTRDRERKLIRKIDEALKRIDDGSYGYCLETGEPIGVKRLEARPVATLSVEAQERRERREKQFGDRDDWYR